MHAGPIVQAVLLQRLLAHASVLLAEGHSPREAERRALRRLRAEGTLAIGVL